MYRVKKIFQGVITDSLFTKRWDVFPQYLVKSRNSDIRYYNDRIAVQFGRHLGRAAAE